MTLHRGRIRAALAGLRADADEFPAGALPSSAPADEWPRAVAGVRK
jgi:hypothetical protein